MNLARLAAIAAHAALLMLTNPVSAYDQLTTIEAENGEAFWTMDTEATATVINANVYEYAKAGADVGWWQVTSGPKINCDEVTFRADIINQWLTVTLDDCDQAGPFAFQFNGYQSLLIPDYFRLLDFASTLSHGGQSEITATATDSDGDGVVDEADNCVLEANANQIAIVDSSGSGGSLFERGVVCSMDFNGSGASDGSDFTIFVEQYGESVGMSCDSFSGGCQ